MFIAIVSLLLATYLVVSVISMVLNIIYAKYNPNNINNKKHIKIKLGDSKEKMTIDQRRIFMNDLKKENLEENEKDKVIIISIGYIFFIACIAIMYFTN